MTDRIVIGAPASSSGKTTVATGLMAALSAQGKTVAAFKVGPDYIDPGYHTLATGRPSRNLDPVLVGEERIKPLFAHGAAGADIAVIEGVMGLFDGKTGGAGFGSTAHVATLLGAPVILVVDASGQGRSFAALLTGFRDYDRRTHLAGVIANRVGSPGHAKILAEACDEVGLRLLGALPRTELVELPSRHLGLVTAAERGPEATSAIDAMARLVADHVDLAAVAEVASVPSVAAPPWCPSAEVAAVPGTPVVAVAGGPAFSFGYAEHLDLLTAAGARVEVFDPVHDDHLPKGTAGVVLPGGFPEQHADALSANAGLRGEILEFARGGGSIHAECGGLLYLVRSLDGRPMCGVIDAEARMSATLKLSYRDAVAATDSALGLEGTRCAGHEFHHTVVSPSAGPTPAWRWLDRDNAGVAEGFVQDGVHASYLHTHPAGNPGMVESFVRRCAGATTYGVARTRRDES